MVPAWPINEEVTQVSCAELEEPPGVIPDEIAALIPAAIARIFGVVPLNHEDGCLVVLAAHPCSELLESELAFALGRSVRVRVGDPAAVRALVRRCYGGETSEEWDQKDGVASCADAADAKSSAEDLAVIAGQPPIIQFVNQVIARAISERSSDIHFEPFEREFKVRCRSDGTLREVESRSRALALPVTSRLKVLANLDIAERRIPQDGRIKVSHGGGTVDLRVSTLPTQFGESVVLRVLDQAAVRLDLNELGLPVPILAGLQRVIRRPNGILLVTGPTGSGKTTTLYSALREINTTEQKVLTIEDPVEYEIAGLRQVPVNVPAGLTFSAALRSFLRHDPDVIMVGEIRDLETAQIGIQAALTGHLVLATMHTNDAPSAVTRLIDMGVEPFLLASTVEAILAQRLVRKICPHCPAPYHPSPGLQARFGLDAGMMPNRAFLHGTGCAACADSGYRGRLGLFEWLGLTDPLRELMIEQAPVPVIQARARELGLHPLREEAREAVVRGATTLEEIARHL